MICTITFVWHYIGVGVWLYWFRMKAISVSMQCVVVHTRPQIWALGATKRGVGARLVHMCGFVCRKLGSPLTSARVALHIAFIRRVSLVLRVNSLAGFNACVSISLATPSIPSCRLLLHSLHESADNQMTRFCACAEKYKESSSDLARRRRRSLLDTRSTS
jgi:hypothetical protein